MKRMLPKGLMRRPSKSPLISSVSPAILLLTAKANGSGASSPDQTDQSPEGILLRELVCDTVMDVIMTLR